MRITNCFFVRTSVAIGVAVCLLASALSAGEPGIVEFRFDTDPGWDGYRNRLLPEKLRTIKQDFGYRTTNHAGGENPGEIGGELQRAFEKAYYAMPIPEATLHDRLEASGKFSVPFADSSSGIMFGWFNKDSKGWRTPNSLAIRVDGNSAKYWVFYEYGTRKWGTGGGGAFEGERYQTTPTKPFPADGGVHEWSLVYDPEANDGLGMVTFTIDGKTWKPILLPPGHKTEGAVFDRFGLFNVQIAGERMEIYFDDVTLNGRRLEFNEDPRWEAFETGAEYEERVVRPFHDFGFSDTSHAGGEPGEIGGIIFRDEQPAYYATEIEKRTLDDELFASGRIAFLAAGSDSGMHIGWFNSASKRNQTRSEHEEPLKNTLGITLEGPSRVGHYFRARYSNSQGDGAAPTEDPAAGRERPVILPDGKAHEWTLRYDPAGAGGNGRITVLLDGEKHTLDLQPEHRQAGATFDRFGLFNLQAGGHHVHVYLDDVQLGGGR